MKILADAVPWSQPPLPVCLALGVFDGVHLGHREVIRRACEAARRAQGVAIAVTFDRHPQSVLFPSMAPPMLYPLWRRLDALEDAGLDGALVFPFDEAFARQSAAEFVGRLARGFTSVAEICVGTSFVFGHRRAGHLAFLEEEGARRGFRVSGVRPVECDGEPVSSTRVRECVMSGEVGRASRLLGRAYTISGEVVAGDRLGRTLGFPTANLDAEGLALPPTGVYAAHAIWDEGSGGGGAGKRLRRPAALNLGRRPTVDGSAGPLRVEAHILDFQGDLYGCRLEVELGPRLRGEVKFGSKNELAGQIQRDVEQVRAWAKNGVLPCP